MCRAMLALRMREEHRGPANHQPVRPLHPWRDEPARISRPLGRTGGLDRRSGRAPAAAEERLCAGRYHRAGRRQAAHRARVLRVAQGQDQRLSRARQSDGQTPRGHLIHENRGLNPHIEDIARRLAAEGYLALAPDLLSVNGGTPPDEDRARELHQKTEREDMIAAALAAIPFMQKHAESTGKVGAVGFCFGGGVVNRMAAGSPDLGAAVPYYGVQIPVEMVPAIKAPLLLQYAENDENINKGIGAYETALAANNKKYTIYIYPGTQHAFNNDTGAARYNKAAAELAWSRTLAFFAENLGAPPKAA